MTGGRLAGARALFILALIVVFSYSMPLPAAAQSSSKSSKDEKGKGEEKKEEGWVLSASAFELFDVPEEYASYASLMPLLIVERLGAAQTRFVSPEEREAREERERSNKRMTLTEERRNLIYSRDSLFFSFDDAAEKKEKREEYDEMIEEKNEEIAELDREMGIEPPQDAGKAKGKKGKSAKSSSKKAGKSSKKKGGKDKPEKENLAVVFRIEEGSLYAPQKGVSLAQSLYRDGISGLLTGSIRDVGGYMYVTASIETGYGAAAERVTYAGHYDDLEDAVSTLAVALLPQISNRVPVLLYITAEPEGAAVTVDGVLVHDTDEPVAVFAGPHTIEASAQGYAASILAADFTESDEFDVDISLLPLESVKVVFDTGEQPAELFLRTQHFGAAPQEVEIPALPQIGEAVYGDVQTFFIFNPATGLPPSAQNGAVTASVAPDKQAADKRISKIRRALYWSLGALYLALPVAFVLMGESNSRTIAYNEGRITDTGDVQPWTIAGNVSVGVCIALGVNLIVQAVRYLRAANQVIPREAELR